MLLRWLIFASCLRSSLALDPNLELCYRNYTSTKLGLNCIHGIGTFRDQEIGSAETNLGTATTKAYTPTVKVLDYVYIALLTLKPGSNHRGQNGFCRQENLYENFYDKDIITAECQQHVQATRVRFSAEPFTNRTKIDNLEELIAAGLDLNKITGGSR